MRNISLDLAYFVILASALHNAFQNVLDYYIAFNHFIFIYLNY